MDRRRAVTWAGVATMVGSAGGFALVAVFGVLVPAANESRLQALAPPPPPPRAGTWQPQQPAIESSVPGREALDTPVRWHRAVQVGSSEPLLRDLPAVADTPLAAPPPLPSSSPRAQPLPVHEAPPQSSGPSGDTGSGQAPPTLQEQPPPPAPPRSDDPGGSEVAPDQPDENEPHESPRQDGTDEHRPQRAEPRNETETAPKHSGKSRTSAPAEAGSGSAHTDSADPARSPGDGEHARRDG